MASPIQVVTTTAKKQEALKIASTLVNRRQAACVQIGGPVTSVYRWNGEIESAEEWICTIKTTDDAFSNVESTIRELHSYDEPEIVATEIVRGSASYLRWLVAEVHNADGMSEP